MKKNVLDLETFRRELTDMLSGVAVTPPKAPETVSELAAAAKMARRAPTAAEYRPKYVLSRQGPWSPLAVLAAREEELHAVPAALAKLPDANNNKAGATLRVHQLMKSVDTSHATRERAKELRHDAISVYASLKSNGPIESMLDAQLVAVHNAALDCLGRAANMINPRAQEVNFATD
jgi:hypothetical protein